MRCASTPKRWPPRGMRLTQLCAMRSRPPPRRFAISLVRQLARILEQLAHRRPHHRPACAPARRRRLLCPQRPSSAPVHAADDGHSRAGCGRRAHRRRFAQARAAKPLPPRICSASPSSIASAARTPSPRSPTEPQAFARVDKIVGPGNLYVTAAKRLVAFDCAIDMLAGPTEIVVTSERGSAADIASDLVAQAEHDPEALAIFITTRADLAKAVIAEAKRAAATIPSRAKPSIATASSSSRPALDEAHAITNRIAPEHLTVDAASDLDWVQNAGSVFIGRWSAQPMGDYISGPNHTLPTGGMARVRGGLSVNDFVKLITVQEYTAQSTAHPRPHSRIARRSRRPHRPCRSHSHPPQRKEEAPWLKPQRRTAARAARSRAGDEGVSPASRQSRRAASRLQREHARLLAQSARSAWPISARRRSRAIPSASPSKPSLPRISASRPRRLRSPTASMKPFTCSSKPSSTQATNCCCRCPPTPCTRSTPSATDARIVTVQAAADLQFPFERLLAAITPRTKIIAIANPNSPPGTVATRAQLIELAQSRAASRRPRRRSLLPFSRRNRHRSRRHTSESHCRAHLLKGLRSCRPAPWPARGPGRTDALGSPRALALQRQLALALACLPPALEDTAYLDWYVAEVLAARAEFETALDRSRTSPLAQPRQLRSRRHRPAARGVRSPHARRRRARARPLQRSRLRWLRAHHHRHARANAARRSRSS